MRIKQIYNTLNIKGKRILIIFLFDIIMIIGKCYMSALCMVDGVQLACIV
jgi:hypothetical protein